MTPPSTARNRSNTQAELSVVLDAAACTTSADASPSAEPSPPSARSARSRTGYPARSLPRSVPWRSRPRGRWSPRAMGSRSVTAARWAAVARRVLQDADDRQDQRALSGTRALGRFGGRLGRWLRGLLGRGLDRTGRPGRCGRFAGLGRPGRCGRFPGLATGRAGRARARESTLGSPLTPLGSASRILSRDSSVHAVASRPSIRKRTTTLRRPLLRTLASTLM